MTTASEVKSNGLLKGCGIALGCALLLVGGGTAGLFAAAWGVGAAMNAGPVHLVDIDEGYELRFRTSRLATHWTDPVEPYTEADGARALRALLETEAVPRQNGLAVLWHHLWYNAITSGYDLHIWLDEPDGYDSYGLYMTGHTVFLRDEAGGPNRVLWMPLTVSEVEDRLAPFVKERAR